MLLSRALRLTPGRVVAFTGAGGKTTALRTLVSEIAAGAVPGIEHVLVSTTTRLGQEQADLADQHLSGPYKDEIRRVPQLLNQHRSLLITGPLAEVEGKWTGMERDVLEELARLADAAGAPFLIEADGARGASLKAPAEHEPAIPDFADLIVPMAGLDVLDRTLHSELVHRPELVAELLELEVDATLGWSEVARVVSHPRGGLKGVPTSAEVRVLLTKSQETSLEAGLQIADALLSTPQIQAVVVADLLSEDPVHEVRSRVAGVVLAAGGSSRLGEPKQLVEWRGQPLALKAVGAALEGGLDPVVAVLGEHADEVRQVLVGEDIVIVENPNWQQGQSSSLQAGLNLVEARAEAVIFLLADMPFVGPDLVRALVDKHRETLSPLIVPWAGGRRANPMLFDRLTYPELHEVEGDQGGRALFKRFDRELVEWDDTILFDVDTPADLERLRKMD